MPDVPEVPEVPEIPVDPNPPVDPIEPETPFSDVYDVFLASITDDMFMELTIENTREILQELLLKAIPSFEFPRFNINDYSITESKFNSKLTNEEKNILALYMVVEWIGYQLASVENIRMKYSGTDFKFTSQANHMSKLNALLSSYTTRAFHLQRLYKRRIADEKTGVYKSTATQIMEVLT